MNATVYAAHAPAALLLSGDSIGWIGSSAQALALRDSADQVVDLGGALVAPGFVDAHVHATSTGLALTGLDLSHTDSLGEALRLIEMRARQLRGDLIIGHGWDETRWPEGRAPTRAEIDRASWGSVVYLSRVDVHSAAVSSALLAAVPEARSLPGFDAEGPLTRESHHAVRSAALSSVTPAQRRAAQRATRTRCAELGIVALHEMAGPTISSAADLGELLTTAGVEPGPTVFGYWGELAADGGIERARDIGAAGVAGDLFADGAIGSRTACLHDPYNDDPGTVGTAYLDADQVAAHVMAATDAGMQAGFHVIGDAASTTVVAGFEAAAQVLGVEAIRSGRHRIEHAEMLSDADIAVLAKLNVGASMQPMFDQLWGGRDQMYDKRLGAQRSAGMNRLRDLMDAGITTAFGSDAPVTQLGAWEAIAAAVHHHTDRQRLAVSEAFAAHTTAGWHLAGHPARGRIATGEPAHLAIWTVDDPDPNGFPRLDVGSPLPRCERTMVSGRTVFDSGSLG